MAEDEPLAPGEELRPPAGHAPEELQQAMQAGATWPWSICPVPDDLRLSVVVPVYNEMQTVEEIIRRIRAVAVPTEIIVVDDGSTDGTGELLDAMAGGKDLRVFRHERNRGKGAALRTAFAQATGQIVIIQDADLEYNPREYCRLIQPIIEGVADVVYG